MPYSLESEIARRYSLTPRQVCVTNGATEAIYLIAQVFQGRISAVLGTNLWRVCGRMPGTSTQSETFLFVGRFTEDGTGMDLQSE